MLILKYFLFYLTLIHFRCSSYIKCDILFFYACQFCCLQSFNITFNPIRLSNPFGPDHKGKIGASFYS